MSDFVQALSVTSSALRAQATRLRHVSENISNADTPGYRRKFVPFEATGSAGHVSVGRVQLDKTELQRRYDPAHPLADESGHFQSSNVKLMVEMADAREAQRSYEANLKMFEQVRRMSSNLMDLLRK